jgi:DNA-directed RNA polymerase delta subunit
MNALGNFANMKKDDKSYIQVKSEKLKAKNKSTLRFSLLVI